MSLGRQPDCNASALFGFPIQFNQLGVINVGPKDTLNRFQVNPVAISSQLNSMGQPGPKIIHELKSGSA